MAARAHGAMFLQYQPSTKKFLSMVLVQWLIFYLPHIGANAGALIAMLER